MQVWSLVTSSLCSQVSPEVVSVPSVKAQMESIDIHESFRNITSWRVGNSPLTLAPDYEVCRRQRPWRRAAGQAVELGRGFDHI